MSAPAPAGERAPILFYVVIVLAGLYLLLRVVQIVAWVVDWIV